MTISANNLGEKLRAAREASGMSTRVAAREAARRGIPVSHTTLANYELGETMPAMPTLTLLATMYSCPIEHLIGSAPSLTGVRYRALKSVRVRDRRHYEGEATRWVHLYLELENLLNKTLRLDNFNDFMAHPNESGKELAVRVRAAMNLEDKQPLSSVSRILETFGMRVIQLDSEARIDGMSAMMGSIPVVALNPSASNDRFRFNAAHELGHHLFEDWRDGEDAPHDGNDRAHEFASHLLMPDSVLKDAFKSLSMVRLVRYKELFGISLAAMIYRGKEAGILTQSYYQKLWREFSRLGWRTREPGYVAPDYSSRLEQLIEESVSEKKMSYGDVARLAAVDESVIRSRVLEAIGGALPHEEESWAPISIADRR